MGAQHGNNTDWPEHQVAILRAMWLDGKSGSEIAARLGNRSRSSVCAKARRLGLKERNAPENFHTSRVGSRPKAKAAPRPPKPGPQNKPAVIFGPATVLSPEATAKRQAEQRAHSAKIIADFKAPANDTAIPLMERRRYQCAWPVGEPDRPAKQMCCGMPVPEGANTAVESYCPAHAKAAMARDGSGKKQSQKEFERSLRRYAA